MKTFKQRKPPHRVEGIAMSIGDQGIEGKGGGRLEAQVRPQVRSPPVQRHGAAEDRETLRASLKKRKKWGFVHLSSAYPGIPRPIKYTECTCISHIMNNKK